MSEFVSLFERGVGVLLFLVPLRFLLDATQVPASVFSFRAWIAVVLAGVMLYCGAVLLIGV